VRRATQPNLRLTRQDWVDEGTKFLCESGIGALSIEALAAHLGVTRGSFYHHFDDRDDLLQSMLAHWARHWTYEVREQVATLGLDPGTTLIALARAVRSRGASEYDAPFRAWALHDSRARAVVQDVDAVRLHFVQAQFEALGFAGLDAENRARLWLYYESAAPAIFAGPLPEKDEQLLLERHRFLTTARAPD